MGLLSCAHADSDQIGAAINGWVYSSITDSRGETILYYHYSNSENSKADINLMLMELSKLSKYIPQFLINTESEISWSVITHIPNHSSSYTGNIASVMKTFTNHPTNHNSDECNTEDNICYHVRTTKSTPVVSHGEMEDIYEEIEEGGNKERE